MSPLSHTDKFTLHSINSQNSCIRLLLSVYTAVILINATKQFWYALQNPKWRGK